MLTLVSAAEDFHLALAPELTEKAAASCSVGSVNRFSFPSPHCYSILSVCHSSSEDIPQGFADSYLGSTGVGTHGGNGGFAYLALGQARDLYVKKIKISSSLHKGGTPIFGYGTNYTIIFHKAEHVWS